MKNRAKVSKRKRVMVVHQKECLVGRVKRNFDSDNDCNCSEAVKLCQWLRTGTASYWDAVPALYLCFIYISMH